MRRRIRSAAAFPVHRHSLPQMAMDAGLVALAYYLAYQLRFDGEVPPLYEDLFERTLAFVILGSVFVFSLFGMYRHWMRYSSQREYMQVGQAVIVATLGPAGLRRRRPAQAHRSPVSASSRSPSPPACSCSTGC